MTIKQDIIDAALGSNTLSYEDRVRALAKASKRLRALDSDPVEQLTNRLVQMATRLCLPNEIGEIGIALDLQAHDLEREIDKDAERRSEISFQIHNGQAVDLSEVHPKTVHPFIRQMFDDVMAQTDPEERKASAAALTASIAMTPVKALHGRNEILLGVVTDMARAGIDPVKTHSAAVMEIFKVSILSIM